MTRLSVLFTAAALVAACHPNHDDVAPTDERQADADVEDELAQAKRIVVDADELDHEQIEELARHIEGLGDVAQAKVKVRKDDEGHTELVVEIAGRDLPADDYLRTEVATFPGLEDADVMVETLHPDELAGPAIAEKGKSAEEIEAEVEARLRADGVEGDVHVEVHDEDGERRVEVRVEKKDAPATDDLAGQ